MSRTISFRGYLPPIQSAITFSGNGDGARVKIDIPGSDIPEALKLLALTGKAFKVTIEPLEEDEA